MNYITLYLLPNEVLVCSCGKISRTYAYIINYKENRVTTAYVRCKKCFNMMCYEEDIKLLEGILGQ